MHASLWVPSELRAAFKNEILKLKRENEFVKADVNDVSIHETNFIPPTYFKLTDLTKPAQ